jgi:hypothetical protein
MRCSLKSVAMGGMVLACLAGPGVISQGMAQEEMKSARSMRGGILATVEGHRFEVFFYPTGVRVFPLDDSGKPRETVRLSGHATFYHPNDPDSPWFSRPLQPIVAAPDHLPTSLDLSVDLAGAPRKGVTVHFEIVGLESKNSSTAEFKVPLRFVAMPTERLAVADRGLPSRSAVTRASALAASPTSNTLGSIATSATSVTPLIYVLPTMLPVEYGTSDYRTFGMQYRDWTTGRVNLPLSRPWLYPKD